MSHCPGPGRGQSPSSKLRTCPVSPNLSSAEVSSVSTGNDRNRSSGKLLVSEENHNVNRNSRFDKSRSLLFEMGIVLSSA